MTEEDLMGLTPVECPQGCSANGCCISGKTYCAHPTKGGLQSGDAADTMAINRIEKARRFLGLSKFTHPI